jgi:hypothetical protein
MLLLKPPNGDVPNAQGLTPLHAAAEDGNVKSLYHYIDCIGKEKVGGFWTDKGIYVREVLSDPHGRTPLHYSAMGDSEAHVKCTEALLKMECMSVFREWGDENGDTPMHIAARHGNVKQIKALEWTDGVRLWEERNGAGDAPVHIIARELVACEDEEKRERLRKCLVLMPGNLLHSRDSENLTAIHILLDGTAPSGWDEWVKKCFEYSFTLGEKVLVSLIADEIKECTDRERLRQLRVLFTVLFEWEPTLFRELGPRTDAVFDCLPSMQSNRRRDREVVEEEARLRNRRVKRKRGIDPEELYEEATRQFHDVAQIDEEVDTPDLQQMWDFLDHDILDRGEILGQDSLTKEDLEACANALSCGKEK